jgi:hypothetical protein
MKIVSRVLSSAVVSSALVFANGSSADAVEVQCAKHQQLAGMLSKKYSETPVGMGTVNEDRYMQLFISRSGSWTILVTRTDGQACIVAAGQNWEKLPVLAEAEPAA